MNLFILAFNAKRDEFKIFSEDEWLALPEDDVEWIYVAEDELWDQLNLLSKEFVGLIKSPKDLEVFFNNQLN